MNGALAAMHGIAPRDETEAMLGAQMVASHCLAMEMSRRALTAEYRHTLIDAAGFANKFMRTYAALVEALTRYRGKGEQKVVVEHVHVHQGAQAIIGAVTAGGGGGSKIEEQARAPRLPYAPGATLRSEDPARDAVPITGGERQTTVPDARRRQRKRRARGESDALQARPLFRRGPGQTAGHDSVAERSAGAPDEIGHVTVWSEHPPSGLARGQIEGAVNTGKERGGGAIATACQKAMATA